MDVDVILVQILLGILLFFIINWIGEQSYSIGYISMSLFVRAEEAPAFNFIFRVLTPIVYLLIVSVSLYALDLDEFVNNIYFINIYYIAFRFLVNILFGRIVLLNWWKQVFNWFFISSLSYLTYISIISERKNLLPDFNTIANELWIVIIIFIYQLFNGVQLSQTGTIRRKENYYRLMYEKYKKLYGNLIDSKTNNDCVKTLIYSIIIYENFNRPKFVRFLENLSFRVSKKEHTLGLMQVKTKKIISDIDSVRIGIDKICSSYERIALKFSEKDSDFAYAYEWEIKHEIILDYNGGTRYLKGVDELQVKIMEICYPNSNSTFFIKSEKKNGNGFY